MFLEFWVVVSVLFVCLFGGLRLCGGVCFVFGFVCLGCWGFSVGGLGGGMRNFSFEKLHAQFAYYKSPELGLNLSGS